MPSIEGAIHEKWANKQKLNSLLSVDRAFTGSVSDLDDLPWCSISRESGFRKAQSNLNRVDETTIRFEFAVSSFTHGREVMNQICKKTNSTSGDGGGFHQEAFDVDDGGRAASMILANEGSIEGERGSWHFFADFAVTYIRP